MRIVKATSTFKKDYKRVLKRGCSKDKFEYILSLLLNDQALPPSTRPHKLVGNYASFWECHIEPDWLLVYEFVNDDLLVLRRTGSHADLFKK